MLKTAIILITVTLLSSLAPGGPVQAVEHPSDDSTEPVQMAAQEAREVPGRVAVRVNGAEIPEKNITALMRDIASRKRHGSREEESSETVRRQAITLLILQELAYQKANAIGLNVEQERVEKAIRELKKRLGTEEEYRKFLERDMLTEEELAAKVKKNIAFDLLFEKEVPGTIVITEEDLRNEYERQKGRYFSPEKIVIADVIFFLDTTDADSRSRAEEVLAKISSLNDRNPRDLVPDGTFIVREMELRKTQEPELYEEAKKLKPGELSGVFNASDNYHIIKLEKYTQEKLVPFEKAKKGLELQMRYEIRQKKTREWEAEMRKGATIEILNGEK